jgi:hypothetical protein
MAAALSITVHLQQSRDLIFFSFLLLYLYHFYSSRLAEEPIFGEETVLRFFKYPHFFSFIFHDFLDRYELMLLLFSSSNPVLSIRLSIYVVMDDLLLGLVWLISRTPTSRL